MAKSLPSHIGKLREYLFQPSERNEDLALSYFREISGGEFIRQADAENADGYVPGHYILEIKGNTSHWYAGLLQGLSYERKNLSFSLVVVCAKGFLGVWRKDHIPDVIRSEILRDTSAPSLVGRKYARKYSTKSQNILRKAIWYRPEMGGALFLQNDKLFLEAIRNFERTIKTERKVRQAITLKNFVQKLEEMKGFFDLSRPIKAVRAFYSMIYGPWDSVSVLALDQKFDDRATLGGSVITNLVPSGRSKFKNFVESHQVVLRDGENIDDFFARYDDALDAVDREFRIKNGIFFTDLDLSKFVMWLVKKEIPDLGKSYIVIDPACGSGNLVTNWRSPLELRHKVVSEIEPELLYAVEQRMKGDQWHNGKFTVVPKVTQDGAGLNFLDRSAAEYLQILTDHLKEKGIKPDKPLAFLCNPPYRSDDDQSAGAITYNIHPSIINLTGLDGSAERYCCFLAQMKLICKAASDSGLPGESVLLLFTKSAWLSDRKIFEGIRKEILGAYETIGAYLVNGKEFFSLKGKFPIAFTMWKFKGDNAGLDLYRPIPFIDLTWMKKKQLQEIVVGGPEEVDQGYEAIVSDERARTIIYGNFGDNIKEWSGLTRFDFQREKRRAEKQDPGFVCGLPKGDARHSRKKTLGERDGRYIGFMDDLTPCRINKESGSVPWFRLNNQFMDCRKTRCFSGPTDNRSYAALDLETARKAFVWYALGRIFSDKCYPYPMWADALEMWPVFGGGADLIEMAFALAFAENECVETRFPANNPAEGAPEVTVSNPMSPNYNGSFWCRIMAPVVKKSRRSEVQGLVKSVERLYVLWSLRFKGKSEIVTEYGRPYFVGDGFLTKNAGIVQIRDYAKETNDVDLRNACEEVNVRLRALKDGFYDFLTGRDGADYFSRAVVSKTRFEKILEMRLALASMLVEASVGDPNFGVTKFAKLFYLADVYISHNLETNYQRQAAGPLDSRAIYNPSVGIFSLAKKYGYFDCMRGKGIAKFAVGANFSEIQKRARNIFSDGEQKEILRLVKLFRELDTGRTEIVATLYACWNDLILDGRCVEDNLILTEFLERWHPQKTRFSKARLWRALAWMRKNDLIPEGKGRRTQALQKI